MSPLLQLSNLNPHTGLLHTGQTKILLELCQQIFLSLQLVFMYPKSLSMMVKVTVTHCQVIIDILEDSIGLLACCMELLLQVITLGEYFVTFLMYFEDMTKYLNVIVKNMVEKSTAHHGSMTHGWCCLVKMDILSQLKSPIANRW